MDLGTISISNPALHALCRWGSKSHLGWAEIEPPFRAILGSEKALGTIEMFGEVDLGQFLHFQGSICRDSSQQIDTLGTSFLDYLL